LAPATNTGDATLTFTGDSVTRGFAVSAANSECLTNFAPGTGCGFGVLFQAKSPGVVTGTFSIYDNAPNSPQTVALSAKATALKIAPTSLTFGIYSLGQTSPARTVTITNVWTNPVTISGMSFSGSTPRDFPISNQTCPNSVGRRRLLHFRHLVRPLGCRVRNRGADHQR
jgi:hypothetical protein